MTPMIAIVAVSSIYRGYFQGRQNMLPSAFSSVLESVIRIFFMLWFSWLLLPKGIAFAAAGAMLGVTVGEIGGMLALLLQYYYIVKRTRMRLRLLPARLFRVVLQSPEMNRRDHPGCV